MNYFSRITFQAADHEGWRRLHQLRGQPYAQHQALWRLFDRPSGSRQPFLFRELESEFDDRLQFLLVSDAIPVTADAGWRVEAKPYAPRLAEGMNFAFELRANPTRSERIAGTRGQRQDYVMSRLHELGVGSAERAAERQRIVREELPIWLQRRAETRGFVVRHCEVSRYEACRFAKGTQTLTVSVADFAGRLEVIDAKVFAQVLRQGLGHGKSFGLGLLLLRRLPSGATE